jgi:hypothetical protein
MMPYLTDLEAALFFEVLYCVVHWRQEVLLPQNLLRGLAVDGKCGGNRTLAFTGARGGTMGRRGGLQLGREEIGGGEGGLKRGRGLLEAHRDCCLRVGVCCFHWTSAVMATGGMSTLIRGTHIPILGKRLLRSK